MKTTIRQVTTPEAMVVSGICGASVLPSSRTSTIDRLWCRPGQRDDLALTLIISAQIDAHKKKHSTAAKNDDAPMNMGQAGGGGDRNEAVASALSLETRDRRPRVTPSMMTLRKVDHAPEGKGRTNLGGKIMHLEALLGQRRHWQGQAPQRLVARVEGTS